MDDWTKRALLWDTIWSLFQPQTPMGQQAKASLPPFLPGEEEAWQSMLGVQEELLEKQNQNPAWARQVERHLSQLPDIRQVIRRLDRGENPGLSDWFQVKQFLWQGRAGRSRLREEGMCQGMNTADTDWERAFRKLNPEPKWTPAFSLSDSFSPELAALRQTWAKWRQRRHSAHDRQVREVEKEYGIKPNHEGEWVVDQRASHRSQMESDSRLVAVRRTPFDHVFQLVPSSEEKEALLRQQKTEEMLKQTEAEVLAELADRMRPETGFLYQAVEEWTRFDLLWARVQAAKTWKGVRPVQGKEFRITGGRHPHLQKILEEQGRRYTPVDVRVVQGATVIIGPNMGGKTSALLALGLIAALGQYGFLVPATSCDMPLTAWIAAVIGDRQEATAGLSTFGAEMNRIAVLLKREEPGLLLMDEVGRGTNPLEGAALSAALTGYLTQKNHWSAHVTHYREVIQVKGIHTYQVAGLSQNDLRWREEEEDRNWQERIQSRMDYRLLPWEKGVDIPRQALVIASSLGIPEDVLRKADQLIKDDGENEQRERGMAHGKIET